MQGTKQRRASATEAASTREARRRSAGAYLKSVGIAPLTGSEASTIEATISREVAAARKPDGRRIV